jgi:hypothetical protein
MGADRLKAAFGGRGGVPAFVAFVTGGFPTRADTVPAMLAMQESGVSVIEVRHAKRGSAAAPVRLPAVVAPTRTQRPRDAQRAAASR